jgi:hypothetical protein
LRSFWAPLATTAIFGSPSFFFQQRSMRKKQHGQLLLFRSGKNVVPLVRHMFITCFFP